MVAGSSSKAAFPAKREQTSGFVGICWGVRAFFLIFKKESGCIFKFVQDERADYRSPTLKDALGESTLTAGFALRKPACAVGGTSCRALPMTSWHDSGVSVRSMAV